MHPKPPSPPHEPIAVVGSACRFAGGASSPSKLWRLLREPRDLHRVIPDSRFTTEGFYHPDGSYHGHANVRHAYLLDEDPAAFDAGFFGIKPAEAEAMDPQQRLLLEVVFEALESGGIPIGRLKGSDTAVYVGSMFDDYGTMLLRDLNDIPPYYATGTGRSILANRISYFYNWHGASISLDTACSSSLVAVHMAVQALRSGESRTALACGTNLILGPESFIVESKLGMLSPDGLGRMWDQGANGYARGEGVAAIVLKTLSAALEDGDHIECVIRETGLNTDGATPGGLTMPSAVAQEALIRSTYARAGLDLATPDDQPQYFEAHGTGTPAGDPIEAEAIHRVFSSTRAPDSPPLYVGSIKTVFGHTEGTAGIAAILKASMALQNSCVPPNMLFDRLSDKVEPFYHNVKILKGTQPWPKVGTVRRASVNSFGFGGANAHAILESYDDKPLSNGVTKPVEVELPTSFVFSAASRDSLRAVLSSYLDFLEGEGARINPHHLALVLLQRKSVLPWRISFAASSVASLRDKIRESLEKETSDVGVKALPETGAHLLGIFTGQGAQYACMGAELIERSEVASGMIERLESYLDEICQEERPSWSLRKEILAGRSSTRVQEAAISQPLSTAIQIMLVDLLRLAGVQLDAVVGHSSGEIAAAYAAGFLSDRHALYVAYFRGFHASRASRGAMLAVGTTSEDATELCADRVFAGRIFLAAVNSSSSVTISGDEDAIEELELVLDDEKKFYRRLRVDKAYHSPQMLPCVEPYMTSLRRSGVISLTPEVNAPTWYSSVYERSVDDRMAGLGNTYWADNMTQPVLFSKALESALMGRSGSCLAIELGAHPALKGPATQTIQKVLGKEIPYSGFLHRETNAMESISSAFGFLWSHLGPRQVDIDKYQRAITGRTRKFGMIKCLPTYPWDHRNRYWHESRSSRQLRLRQRPVNPLLGNESVDSAPHCMSWKHLLRVSEMSWLSGHQVQGQVVFPMSGYLSTAFEAARVLAANAGEKVRLIEMNNFVVHQAVVLDHDRGVEVMVSMAEITRKPGNRIAARFTYSAALGQKLTLAASGDVEVILGEPDASLLPLKKPQTPHMIDVESERFYSALDDLGYNFTDYFRSLEILKRRNGIASCLVKAKVPSDDQYRQLLVHPVDLDGALQSLLLAYSYPYDEQLRNLHLPTSIRRIRVNPASLDAQYRNDDELLAVEAVIIHREASDRGVSGHVDIYSNKCPNAAIQVHQGTFMPLGEATSAQDRRVFSKVCWINSQPDGLAAASSINLTESHRHTARLLERIATFYLRKIDTEVKVAQDHPSTSEFPLERYLAFARHITSLVDAGQHRLAEKSWRDDTMEDIVKVSQPYRHLPDVEIMHLVGSNIAHVLAGDANMLEVFRADGNDILDRYYAHGFGLRESSRWVARVVQQIVDRYPHMNMLELGAGTGGATKAIFNEIGGSFASYTYTDISASFFKTAASVFSKNSDRMLFKTLDAEKDPIEQGFREGSYDLIVAFFVIHATSNLGQCLRNIRKLLRPGGFLVVGEGFEDGRYSVASSGFIFGTLPGWWLGSEEGRSLSPIVSPEEWDKLLRSNGFSGVDEKPPAGFCETLNVFPFVSQAVNSRVNLLREPLAPSSWSLSAMPNLVIVGGTTRRTSHLAQGLHSIFTNTRLAGSVNKFDSITDVEFSLIHPNTAVISLSELDQPIFKNITEQAFHALKNMFSSGKTLLWVTSGRLQDEPYSNMTVGFGRCAANETPDLRLQQLDIAEPESTDSKAIAEILIRFWHFTNETTGERGLWSVEPEIVIDRDQRHLLARLRPISELNDRYNSVNWSVTRDQDIGLSPVTVQLNSTGCTVRELHEGWTRRLDSTTDMVELHTTQSVMSALRTPCSYRYLICGRDTTSQQTFLALVPTLTSVVSIPVESGVHVPQFQDTKIHIAQILHLTAAHLLAMSILGALYSGQTLLAHSAPMVIAHALEAHARLRDVRVVFTTDSDRTDYGTVPDSWVKLARNTSQYEVEEILQLIEPAAFVELSGRATGDSSLVKEIITSASGNRSMGCPIIITARELYSNASVGCGNALFPLSSASILGDFLRKGLEFAQADIQAGYCFLQPPLVRLDNLARGECSHSDPLSILDWTDLSPMPVQISRLDAEPMFRSSGSTYWILGMTGALGLSLVDWMIRKGARHIVMTSRNPDVSPDWIASHARKGAIVVVLACDVTDESALRSAHRTICDSMPPIAGVINGAMVLRDTSLRNMSMDQLTDVLGPKVNGSLYLDRIFAEADLDFFVLVSSINCVIGNWGQANYAAANTFMCSLAANRRKRGLRAAAVNGGAIVGAGYMERESRRALDQIVERLHMMRLSEDDWCMSICEAIDACRLDSPHGPEISTGLSDVPFDVPNAPLWYANPKFSSFVSQRGLAQGDSEGSTDSSTSSVSVADRLVACKTQRDVVAVVREAFAAQLRLDLRISMSDDDLMASRSNEIGLDSLVSVDLASWFRKKLQVGIPVLRIMSNESLESLVEYAAGQVPADLLPGLAHENGVVNHEQTNGVEAKSMNQSEDRGVHANGTVIDWEAEARPPADIGFLLKSSPSHGSVPVARTPRVIVLTGVTGLLGRHLLRHLLSHSAVQRVICLAVRNLASRLASGELSQSDSRVSYYEGELSHPLIGLTPEQAASIFSEADSVIHNGADTSHMKTYAALKASNVGSTTALIRLCLPRRVPIHFVSSAGLAVLYCSQDNGAAPNGQKNGFTNKQDSDVPVFPEVSVASTPPTIEFSNFGYMCCKWVSERLLEHIVEDVDPGLRVSIHRPSTILREAGTRDAEEARSQLDWVNSLLQYARDLKAIPAIEHNIGGALDLVLVDSVCKGILREVFDDYVELQGYVRYVHEVGDVVIPLKGMESSEYFLTTNGADKLNGNVSEYGELIGTVKKPAKKPLEILPMQMWLGKATTAGMHPAVAELIQVMDAPGASAYPKLHKKTA